MVISISFSAFSVVLFEAAVCCCLLFVLIREVGQSGWFARFYLLSILCRVLSKLGYVEVFIFCGLWEQCEKCIVCVNRVSVRPFQAENA